MEYSKAKQLGEKIITMPKAKKRKVTGEANIYRRIWLTRPHYCTNCKCHLPEPPIASYFSHVLSKKQFPDLRLNEKNIELHCVICHNLRDHGTKSQYEARRK